MNIARKTPGIARTIESVSTDLRRILDSLWINHVYFLTIEARDAGKDYHRTISYQEC